MTGGLIIGLALIVATGSTVASVAVTSVSGCLVFTELTGWVGGAVVLPPGLRWAGIAAIAVSMVLAVRLARRAVRSRGVALGLAWLAMTVLANPLWALDDGYRGVELAPGGAVAMLAMLLGLIILTVALLRGGRSGPSGRGGRSGRGGAGARPEPLNAAEVASRLRHDGRAIALTAGAGAGELQRVVVAVTAGGALVFDTERDGRLAASIAGRQVNGAGVSLLVDAEPPVRVHGVARLVSGVERDRCLELYLGRFPDRLARALSDRIAHVVLTPDRVEPL